MKTVFFDIDTQIDFMFPAGALYLPGAECIVPLIAQLNQSAEIVVSTMCAHAENDPEFRQWPPHCIVGTTGQLKPQSTLRSSGQIILEKQKLDLFTNPNLPKLLFHRLATVPLPVGRNARPGKGSNRHRRGIRSCVPADNGLEQRLSRVHSP